MPLGADALGFAGHAEDRRDADPPGDEQVALPGLQREGVARAANRQRLADPQAFVHFPRAATALGIQQHADAQARTIQWIAAQRVLAHQAGRQQQVDMRPRAPFRQRAAVRRLQFQGDHAFGFQPHASDLYLQLRTQGAHDATCCAAGWWARSMNSRKARR
ncbi:hypothetical protein D9M71_687540 [compost metagenome]